MLTTAEEDRLEETFPSTVTVEWDGQNGLEQATYDLARFWTGPDAVGNDASQSAEHPTIVFDWDTQSEEATQRQPADNVRRIENPVDEPEYTEVRTSELYSDLTIQVAVRSSWEDGIPPTVRLKQLTRAVWQVCDRELDQAGALNEAGQSGERPMTVDITSSVTTNREDRTIRSQWTIRLHYRDEHEVVHETAESADFEAEETSN